MNAKNPVIIVKSSTRWVTLEFGVFSTLRETVQFPDRQIPSTDVEPTTRVQGN